MSASGRISSFARLLVVVCSIAVIPAVSSARSDVKPNFIVILFDDLGYRDIGYNGSEIKTPRIDALAAESLVFDQFYVFPWCSSTRAAVETGMNPAAFGMRSLQHNFENESALPRSVPTLAQRLGTLGYFNMFAGKWHLSRIFENGPLRKGYHKAYGYLSGQIDHLRHDDHHGKHVLFEGEQFIEDEGHMTDLIFRESAAAIETAKRPFFVNISFSAPHYPVQSLPAYEERNSHIADPDRRAYAGMVTHMDDVIGNLVDRLRASGDLSNTYIFVFSDNGAEKSWSNPNYYNGRFPGRRIMGVNEPLREFKTSAYEGGIRVPSFVFGPGVPAGRRTKQFTSVLDVVRTIIDLTGADGAGDLEGGNLLEIAAMSESREADFFWQTNSESIPYGGGHQEAVRSGRYKLIRSQQRFSWFPWRWKWPWDQYELFDLDADIGEKNDLSDSRPELVEQLLEKMNARQEAYRSVFEKLSADSN